jgi:hypothetical protein
MRRCWTVVLLIAATLTLVGCSDFVDRDQSNAVSGAAVSLEPGHPVGQTFVARHAGLDGIEVWLEPGGSSQGEIVLHLRADAQAAEDLATAALPLGQVAAPGFYRLSFAPLRQSHGDYYYGFLEVAGEGRAQVGVGSGAAYLDGALYRDHEPLDAQMAFRLTYDPRWVLFDLGWAALNGLGLLAVACLLYVVPGWALLAWLWPDGRFPWAARLGIATGLSLALYPLLLLWTGLVGLHLGPFYVWLPVAGGFVALAWHYRTWRPWQGWQALWQWAHSEALWPDLALVGVLALVFGVRLLTVRTLDAPMWGDSYQHTMIAQLLVDNGGLFDSWAPYAPLQTFTYHFGFHAAVAAFHWLTGLEVVRSVIWVGQVLSGLAVLVLYPLAVRVSGNRWAGVGAVLIAGLLSPMPMSYVNWGRYTQLAGQVILPAAVLASWSAFESPRRDWRFIVLGWIGVGGLALTHYRVLIFYIVFVLAWVLLCLRRETWRRALARTVWVGIGAGILFLPWFVHTSAGKILSNFGQQLATPATQLSAFAQEYNAIGDLSAYLAPLWWLVLSLAVAVGLWQRRREVLVMSTWWFLLLVATNPNWLALPGSGAISNYALFIAVYILAGVLVGDLLGQVTARLPSRRWCAVLIALSVLGLGLRGALIRLGDVRPFQHALVTRPDMRAMVWMRENTPEDARFLVNSFFAYGGGVIVGSDGGWWLPLLAGRANTVPPLNYGTERGPMPDYRQWINDLTWQVQGTSMDAPAILDMLGERGITHVYIGQQQGRVNYSGPDVLAPEALLNSAHYRLAYHQDRVWVFEVVR